MIFHPNHPCLFSGSLLSLFLTVSSCSQQEPPAPPVFLSYKETVYWMRRLPPEELPEAVRTSPYYVQEMIRAYVNGPYQFPKLDISLSEEQKKELAKYIVESCNWRQQTWLEYHEALEYEKHRDVRCFKQPSTGLTNPDNYMDRVWIPAVLKKSKDPGLLAFVKSEEIDKLRESCFLDFVAKYYVQLNPSKRNGWAFLWYFAGTEEEEVPYCRVIKKVIEGQKLDRFAHGRRLKSLLAPIEYRPNNGRCMD